MSDVINKLLNEYRETEKCLKMGVEWLPDNDFARGKLEVVEMILQDLEDLKKNHL
ncbi:MAG: hypothetical protein ACRC7N_08965 [Clostridium sp.]